MTRVACNENATVACVSVLEMASASATMNDANREMPSDDPSMLHVSRGVKRLYGWKGEGSNKMSMP